MNRLILRLLSTGAVAAAMLIPAANVDAQSSQAMDQLYGQGVHAYHSGQMQNAANAFSQAIALGSRDPRVYYFRGLSQAGMGNTGAASGDFSVGAQMEASATGRHYAVGRSLERVQGALRIEIEGARRNARLMARSQTDAMSSPGFVQDNYNNNSTTPVIPDPVPAGQVAPMQTNLPDVSGIQNPGTPFGDTSSIQPAQPDQALDTTEPTQPVETPEQDPFGDPQPPQPDQDQPMEADPFGDPQPPEPAPEQTPPMEEEDPFGDPQPPQPEQDPPMEEEDPFGGDEGGDIDPPMEEEDPFGGEEGAEEAPPTEEDPFGGEEGAEEAPPAEEDPFGGEEGGEEGVGEGEMPPPEPDDEDPFGDDDEDEDPFGDDDDEEKGDGTP